MGAIDRDRLKAFAARERAAFEAARPLSAARARATRDAPGFLDGAPLHWMVDWPTPFPLVVAQARGTRVVDLDGHELTDLCLGDTGAMFGHGPEPVARAIAEQARRGLTAMLPSADAARAGALLVERFGLPAWQVALSASDANRFALKAARLVTGRRCVLAFDGCYHGAVDETGVDLDPATGATRPKPSLWGPVAATADTIVVPFNDEAALAEALAARDVACLILEPALTNCGIVAPAPGFLEAARRLTRDAGALMLIDETHTLSTGLGGWTRVHGLDPDIFVAGKAVAGGVACGVWGLSAETASRLARARAAIAPGHSGVGTTLSGSPLQMAALAACLGEVMTEAAYADMLASAAALEVETRAAVAAFDLPWSVVRIGARLETVFAPAPPRDAAAMRSTFDPSLEAAIHLGLINRGFLVTPFHDMLLAGPGLAADVPARYGRALRDILSELVASSSTIHR